MRRRTSCRDICPPEASKDENGNPIKPPEGMKPLFGWDNPEENTGSKQTPKYNTTRTAKADKGII